MHPNLKQTLTNLGRSPHFVAGASILSLLTCAALGGPSLFPFDEEVQLAQRLAAPSSAHLFGCDLYGRDIFSAMLMGARSSLYIALTTVCLSLSIGTVAGLVAGYLRGVWDHLIMRLVDVLMAFPGILLTMTLASLLGPSLHNLIISIAATGWTSFTRIVRGQVLSLSEREFITANQALGASVWRTMIFHILPAILSPILITATFSLSGVILIEASLSFLGLGKQDGAPTWGSLLSQGRTVLTEAPHLSIVPGLAIMLLVLSFNFIGDALRDTLDPKEGHKN